MRTRAFIAARLLLFFPFLLLSAPPMWVRADAAPGPVSADRIFIVKSSRTMTLLHGKEVLKVYKIALGTQPRGAKQRQGDHRTPEGRYRVDSKNPHSRFHLALHLSYPNAIDRENASRLGVNPGGNIEIHGLPAGYAWVGAMQHRFDWTDGCIAVTNHEIEEIYPMVPVGTLVEIKP
ncbi:MAG TPA: L,D-transpeptidase family protein [Candidatus Acidoferrales bacterium]|nr:L,D-transpeptidase family protein [Candidatus Acidoferrales bacterium]